MTESSPVTHVTPLDPPATGRARSGRRCPNTECRIVDVATGEELGAGEEGEVCVRGPQVMRGYLDDPEATAATVDADGWLHTGDVGRADEDGYVVLVDRVKELIKYKGYQVAPAELEARAASTHPAVADAAVIGRARRGGRRGAQGLRGARRRGHRRRRSWPSSPSASRPTSGCARVEFVDEIPKSPSGKILRRVLNERERRRIRRHALAGLPLRRDPHRLARAHRRRRRRGRPRRRVHRPGHRPRRQRRLRRRHPRRAERAVLARPPGRRASTRSAPARCSSAPTSSSCASASSTASGTRPSTPATRRRWASRW